MSWVSSRLSRAMVAASAYMQGVAAGIDQARELNRLRRLAEQERAELHEVIREHPEPESESPQPPSDDDLVRTVNFHIFPDGHPYRIWFDVKESDMAEGLKPYTKRIVREIAAVVQQIEDDAMND